MKLTTRLLTMHQRLKLRLIEDEIADLEMDLVMADHQGPAWGPLTRNLFRYMATRDALRRSLSAAGVLLKDQAMGNWELLTWGLLSVLAVLAPVMWLGVA